MKTALIAIGAFVLAFLVVVGAVSQVQFLWSAFHHGGI